MLPRWLATLPLLVPACFRPSYDHPRCGSNGECPSGLTCREQVCEADGAPADAPPDICIGRFVVVCRSSVPPDLTFAVPETINTDTDPRCTLQNQRVGAPLLCVIAGNDIQVDAQIVAIGSHPLVLAAFHDLNITANGKLVLTSHAGGELGAGANDPACHLPMEGVRGTYGSGGGAGGSFGGSGGAGGRGYMGTVLGGTAGDPIAVIVRVTGGCKGSPGGPSGAEPGGTPGDGGGAVMLIVANTLTLAGSITAGGGGGLPGPATYSGPGGGGSGGFVGLDAVTYAITGQVTANGGGGASSESSNATISGRPGADGTSSTTIAAAGGAVVGGTDNDAAGGGSGSISTQSNGSPGQNVSSVSFASGGGGGGSAGVILVNGIAPAGGPFSPPPTYVPWALTRPSLASMMWPGGRPVRR